MKGKLKILVTGGGGSVGCSRVKKLVTDPNNFGVVVDNLIAGSIRKFPSFTYLTRHSGYYIMINIFGRGNSKCNRNDEFKDVLKLIHL